MFRVSSRSISGPFHRYVHPSLTHGTANLRQFHHISALCSEFDTKPDTKAVDSPTDSNKSTSKPPRAPNWYTSWSSKLLGLFGGSSNSPASEVSHVTLSQTTPASQPAPPSQPPHSSTKEVRHQRPFRQSRSQQSPPARQPAPPSQLPHSSTKEARHQRPLRRSRSQQSPPARQPAPPSQPPHPSTEEVRRQKLLRRNRRQLENLTFQELMTSKLSLYEKAKKELTEEGLRNPTKRAELLSLLDNALEYAQKFYAYKFATAKQAHETVKARIRNPESKELAKTESMILDGNSHAIQAKTQAHNLQKERIELLSKFSSAESPGVSSNLSTQRHTKEHSALSLDSKENIVAQLLESSLRNAPAAALVDTEAQIKEPPKEDDKESLAHISKYIETKSRGELSSNHLGLTALDTPMPPVPGVSYGLDRVLFNPGVYHLRDPRSRVYNFDPYLSSIMSVSEFDFTTLKPYITSSKDVTALGMAAKHQKKYYGSSSSMTSALSHFHYLLSGWRPIDTRYISQGFQDPLRSFTRLLRAPIAMFVHYKEKEDVYAIDADKEFDSSNVLMHLGKSMEKLLTLPKEEFERYRRSSANKITPEEEESASESYHYTTSGNFLMRSQLDAYDPRLPGTGMYDLKTRAVISIRMDASNPVEALGYEIKDRFGNYESYEREYFDMIRSAFLKYSLQVRVGRMDGIFVAYHNIERIFGFQYISLPEMDQSLHGQADTALGDKEFELSLGLWEKILDRATAKFPKQSLRFHFETRAGPTPFMYIFAQPVTSEQIYDIQTKNEAQIQALQEQLFNPGQPRSRVMDLGDCADPEPSPDENSEAQSSEDLAKDITQDPDYDENLLAMTLVTTSTVNGQPVERPMDFRACDEWRVSYELNDLNTRQGNALLKLCKMRRAEVLDKSGADDPKESDESGFIKLLWSLAEKGRKFRQRENYHDQRYGITVYGEQKKSV